MSYQYARFSPADVEGIPIRPEIEALIIDLKDEDFIAEDVPIRASSRLYKIIFNHLGIIRAEGYTSGYDRGMKGLPR